MVFLKRSSASLILWLLLAQAAFGQSPEYKLKAAYLCRLVDYIEWPPEAFSATNSPLIIGVLGRDPFGNVLDEIAQGQISGGHPLVVRRFASLREVADCEVLYISSSEAPAIDAILHDLGSRPILTVGDMRNFVEHGGMIRFFTENNKVRLRINLRSAKSCQLSISSRLLQLADKVIKEEPPAP